MHHVRYQKLFYELLQCSIVIDVFVIRECVARTSNDHYYPQKYQERQRKPNKEPMRPQREKVSKLCGDYNIGHTEQPLLLGRRRVRSAPERNVRQARSLPIHTD